MSGLLTPRVPVGAATPAARTARIRARVVCVPPGFVATYGDVWPPSPRLTGRVLRTTGADLPWWRVVRSDGSLVKGERQRALLEDEGVEFRGERVDMRRHRMPASALVE